MPTVFANGIWKSGNNLLMRVLDLWGIRDLGLGLATSLLVGRHYWMRRVIRGPRFAADPVPVGLDMGVNVGARWLRHRLRRAGGRYFTGHAAFSDRLLQILRAEGVRPIQIVRDPRDIAVSYAHWIVSRPDFYAHPRLAELTTQERIQAIIRGWRDRRLHFESLATVLDRSYGWITRPDDVLVVRFEDLVGSRGGGDATAQNEALRAVASWCGLDPTRIPDVAEHAFGQSKTFRKGEIGGWRSEFSDETAELFERVVGPRLAHWGYG